jgi:protein-tyrosine phosphatase
MNDPSFDDASALSRYIHLDGAANFRDVGGYFTADGRRVAWGRLFRSDSLADLSDNDLKRIGTLRLRTVFDLRHENERQHKPDRLPTGPVLRFSAHGPQPEGVFKDINSGRIGARELESRILDVYKLFATEYAEAFRAVIDAMLELDSFPAVIHCTSGKDRTGFAIAIILRALGVRRETITHDYMLSNNSRRNLSFLLAPDVDPEVVAVLTGVNANFLEAAFETVEETWGSEETFLAEALGIGKPERQHLCAMLLEA